MVAVLTAEEHTWCLCSVEGGDRIMVPGTQLSEVKLVLGELPCWCRRTGVRARYESVGFF